MITLFKKQQKQATVAEIHAAVDNAQEILLAEANKILEEMKTPVISENLEEKANLLVSLGFTNSIVSKEYEKQNARASEVKEIIIKNKAKAELIQYYKENYPFLKFLTIEAMEDICNKYGLIMAPIKKYKEDVPMKNLLEIKNAKDLMLKDNKKLYEISILKVDSDCSHKKEILEFTKNKKIVIEPYDEEQMIASILIFLREKISAEIRWFNTPETEIEYRKLYGQLFIAAPKSHFDLSGLKKSGKYSYGKFKTKKGEPMDPIVFRYVREGIQVLTKWGEEAKEEALINEILN